MAELDPAKVLEIAKEYMEAFGATAVVEAGDAAEAAHESGDEGDFAFFRAVSSKIIELQRAQMDAHPTELIEVLDSGHVEIVTYDKTLQEKVSGLFAKKPAEQDTFTYWTGEEEETVHGTVSAILSHEPFRFTVLPREE